MLRVLITAALVLMVVFTGIGLATSKAWGWSEYASDALYVVYAPVINNERVQFFVNLDTGVEQQLVWNDKALHKVISCSPNGRTLAFLTDSSHLYVMTREGILYERPIDPGYLLERVSDNGMVALMRNDGAALRVTAAQADSSAPAQSDERYNHYEVSTQGLELWTSSVNGVQLKSPNGALLLSLPNTYMGRWLAPESFFAVTYLSGPGSSLNTSSGQYLIDIPTRNWVRLSNSPYLFAISPDGEKVAAYDVAADASPYRDQMVIPKLLALSSVKTHAPPAIDWPTCFLTFRPQMLIDGS
nr:hypothetical protein [uncultured bacterium]